MPSACALVRRTPPVASRRKAEVQETNQAFFGAAAGAAAFGAAASDAGFT